MLAVSVAGIAQPVAGDGDGGGSGGGRTPDTFVTDWDAVGIAGVHRRRLTPAEGHTHLRLRRDRRLRLGHGRRGRLRAVRRGHRGARRHVAEAAVAAAAHRILVHYLPAQSGPPSTPPTRRRSGRSPTVKPRPTAWRRARKSRTRSSPCAPTTGSGRRCVHAAEPTHPRRVDPDAGTPTPRRSVPTSA